MQNSSNGGFQFSRQPSVTDVYRFAGVHGLGGFNIRQNPSLHCLLPPIAYSFPAPSTTSAASLLSRIPSQPTNINLLGFPLLGEQSQQTLKPEPKPTQSYIGLIAMAILNSTNRRLVLSDIYQWIMTNYLYFRTRGTGWKNSIRHNLSLNDCFIKAGRCPNGKGHYWTIHPANMDDFIRGDFRRRRAQQKVKRYMQHDHIKGESLSSSSSSSSSEDEMISPASTYSSFEDTQEDTKLNDNKDSLHKDHKRKRKAFDIESLLGIGQSHHKD